MYFRGFVSCFLAGLMAANGFFLRPFKSHEEFRVLLVSLRNVKDDDRILAALFNEGDAHITDLIKALHDPDRNISLRAQIVIRYLGNERGMNALEEWYMAQSEIVRSGPIPIPLTERDYQWIAHQSINDADSYIYALALDGSRRARAVLNEMIQKTANSEDGNFSTLALKRVRAFRVRKVLVGGDDPAKLVLQNAFFIDRKSRQYASTSLLGFNGRKDKALVKLYVNRGVLAEEWYHVVLRKYRHGWRFFSITEVAVS